MTIVLDASTLLAALVDSGREGSWAESLIESNDLAAPELILVETTNILRRLELGGELEPTEAAGAQELLLQLDIHLFPYQPFAGRIWELRRNVTSYDAWYVAVAEALDCPLSTLDRKLASASGLDCPVLIP